MCRRPETQPADARDAPGARPAGQSPDALVAEVGRVLRCVSDGGQIVVALSGGPDSTALALLTVAARPDLAIALAHVRHGLRPDRADQDIVLGLARRLGLPLTITAVEVRRAGQGVEAAARDARYTALRKTAADVGAAAILVGHTADDQAETLLLRLARGTGVPGLAGMRPVAGDLVRPLLRLRRADVRAVTRADGIATVEDPMNRDPALRRSRARHEALPALASLHPDPVGALTRLADLAAEDAAALDQWARRAEARLARCDGATADVDADAFARLPVAVARRVVRRLLWRLRGGVHPPSAVEVARILDLPDPGAVDLTGVRVTRRGTRITLGPPGRRRGGSAR